MILGKIFRPTSYLSNAVFAGLTVLVVSCSPTKEAENDRKLFFRGFPISNLAVDGISDPFHQAVFRGPDGKREVIRIGDILGEEQYEVMNVGGGKIVLREAGRYRPLVGEPKQMVITFDPAAKPEDRQHVITISRNPPRGEPHPARQIILPEMPQGHGAIKPK